MQAKDLLKEKCVPCKDKNLKPMDKVEAQDYTDEVFGWALDSEAKKISKEFKFKDFIVISPDEGSSHFTEHAQGHKSHSLKKTRKETSATDNHTGIHGDVHTMEGEVDVKDKNICILDDIISTGGTIIRAVEHLKKLGANKIIVGATHGVFAGEKIAEKILKTSCSELFVTNAILQNQKLKVKILKLQ